MSVNKYVVPLLAIVLFLGTVGIAQATGNWIVSGKQMVDPGNLTAGTDIRGWMSLQQVADGMGMDVAQLYTLLGLPAGITPDTALKDLEGIIPGFEVSTVREVVDGAQGSASAPDETVPPVPSVTPEAAHAAPTPVPPTPTLLPVAATAPTATATLGHTPQGEGSGSGMGDGAGPTPLPAGTLLAPADVKGRHTLAEIAGQGQVDLGDLLAALNLPADTESSLAVRDLVEKGLVTEVEDVRNALAALQAR